RGLHAVFREDSCQFLSDSRRSANDDRVLHRERVGSLANLAMSSSVESTATPMSAISRWPRWSRPETASATTTTRKSRSLASTIDARGQFGKLHPVKTVVLIDHRRSC